ncbi:MAG TPA: EVE domain-containing protein [Gemmatimonadaceae bacterium]|nr:EVE domain-containing protein [Gemmatimonadaceae bacterium]
MERNYWLFKTEPSTFSFDDLMKAPNRTTSWDGVRNFQARNMLRDQVAIGDLVFIYHSSADPTGIAGTAEVVRAGYPDPSAFDKKDSHFDPKSDSKNPTWYLVDVRAMEPLPRFITLDELRKVNGLEDMVLLKRGSRLSIQPVKQAEWEIITKLR